MSVSLILLPVGLALYAVMGKENFEKWVNSMQVKVPTTFANQQELALCVRKAGYDADDWAGMVKTHIRGEAAFFFWQLIDGVWTAVFDKSIPQSEIKTLIARVEKAAGRQVFVSESPTEVSLEANPTQSAGKPAEPPPLPKKGPSETGQPARRRVQVLDRQVYPTNFRDKDLLLRVLAEYTLNPTVDAQGRITCQTGNCEFVFTQQDDQPFMVDVVKAPELSEVFQNLAQLNQSYCEVIQADAVRNVKSRLHEKGLVLEQEEVLPDKTIVLTVEIP